MGVADGISLRARYESMILAIRLGMSVTINQLVEQQATPSIVPSDPSTPCYARSLATSATVSSAGR
jgi:hypothetical protein